MVTHAGRLPGNCPDTKSAPASVTVSPFGFVRVHVPHDRLPVPDTVTGTFCPSAIEVFATGLIIDEVSTTPSYGFGVIVTGSYAEGLGVIVCQIGRAHV